MPLLIVRNDITNMRVDAIVNAANHTLLGGGGVDGAIHRAAGPGLLAECRKLGGCETGDAKVTRGHRLPCRWVIHTVGPQWQGGTHGEREKLVSCYRTSLLLAEKHGCKTVAFPLISSGIYGYPKEQALRVASDTIQSFLMDHDMTVYLVVFDRAAYTISGQLFAEVAAYVDDCYVDLHRDERREMQRANRSPEEDSVQESFCMARPSCAPPPARKEAAVPRGLLESLRKADAGFSETLLMLIDRTGKKDSEIYKKANVDRKLFSKIRSKPSYKPSKSTALAFAIALELDLEETKDLIARAGFALSHSSRFDIIVEYFIVHKIYDVFAINETLFAFDQPLIGG